MVTVPDNIEINSLHSLRLHRFVDMTTPRGRGNWSGYQHGSVGTVSFPIDIRIDLQTIIQHSQIQSQIIIHRFLPFQIGIPEPETLLAPIPKAFCLYYTRRFIYVGLIGREVLDFDTNWKTQFQPVHPIPDKASMNIPSHPDRPIIREALIRPGIPKIRLYDNSSNTRYRLL